MSMLPTLPHAPARAPSAPAGGPDAGSDLAPQAEAAAALLRALAHPGRLQLLCALVTGECCVGGLARATGLTQPSLSQQLGVLRSEGLVGTRREGRHVHYALASEAARAVLAALHAHFCPPHRATGSPSHEH